MRICDFISDHSVVTCKLNFKQPAKKRKHYQFRNFRDINIQSFRENSSSLHMIKSFHDMNFPFFVAQYDGNSPFRYLIQWAVPQLISLYYLKQLTVSCIAPSLTLCLNVRRGICSTFSSIIFSQRSIK